MLRGKAVEDGMVSIPNPSKNSVKGGFELSIWIIFFYFPPVVFLLPSPLS